MCEIDIISAFITICISSYIVIVYVPNISLGLPHVCYILYFYSLFHHYLYIPEIWTTQLTKCLLYAVAVK